MQRNIFFLHSRSTIVEPALQPNQRMLQEQYFFRSEQLPCSISLYVPNLSITLYFQTALQHYSSSTSPLSYQNTPTVLDAHLRSTNWNKFRSEFQLLKQTSFGANPILLGKLPLKLDPRTFNGTTMHWQSRESSLCYICHYTVCPNPCNNTRLHWFRTSTIFKLQVEDILIRRMQGQGHKLTGCEHVWTCLRLNNIKTLFLASLNPCALTTSSYSTQLLLVFSKGDTQAVCHH